MDVAGETPVERRFANQAFNNRSRNEQRLRRHGRQFRDLTPGNRDQKSLSRLDPTQDFSAIVAQLSRRYLYRPARILLAGYTADDHRRLTMLGVVLPTDSLHQRVRKVWLVPSAALAANQGEGPALGSLVLDVPSKLTLREGSS